MIPPDASWRPMTAAGLAAVQALAAAIHPGLFEAPEVLAERQALYGAGCFLLAAEEGPVGYVLSHPWRADALPALNTRLGAIPADADTYYLHDLALLPGARGRGAAGRIIAALAAHAVAAGFGDMRLVAIGGSSGFWHKHGFETRATPGSAAKLRSYGSGASLMVRPLGS